MTDPPAEIWSKNHLGKIVRPMPQERPPKSRLDGLRLDKNESLDTHLAQLLHEKISKVVTPAHLSVYAETGPLYAKLAGHVGVGLDQLFIAHGSDGVIRAVFEAIVRPGDTVIISNPTFAMYSVYCDVFEAQRVTVDYDSDLQLSLETVREEIARGASLFALPNPDSPTGSVLPKTDLEALVAFARENGTVVLIDEAYYPYYETTALGLANRFDNLVVTRTFSKAWALAGYRVGYGVASAKLTRLLHGQKPMYEVGTVSTLVACAALDCEQDIRDSVKRTMKGKKFFSGALQRMGFKVIEGHANFLLVDLGPRKKEIVGRLAKRNILFKESFEHPSLAGLSRFTVGPKEVMTEVVDLIEEV